MIAIVCGGRDYTNAARVKQILDAAVERMGLWCIIQGAATGADALSAQWATSDKRISMISVPADWSVGKSAGAIRNKKMLDMLVGHDGDKAVIAFPGGRGTANLIAQAKGAGIRVIEIDR